MKHVCLFLQGGTLIEYEGKQRLLEIAQVPKEHVSAEMRRVLDVGSCLTFLCCKYQVFICNDKLTVLLWYLIII